MQKLKYKGRSDGLETDQQIWGLSLVRLTPARGWKETGMAGPTLTTGGDRASILLKMEIIIGSAEVMD